MTKPNDNKPRYSFTDYSNEKIYYKGSFPHLANLGIFTINELRDMLNLKPIENGDEIFLRPNLNTKDK